MYASAPATYAQAPTMTSMYASPPAGSMYMPAGQIAAGQYAAAPTMVETIAAPSYVPAMTTMAAPQVQYAAAAPQMVEYAAAPQVVEVVAPGPAFNMPPPVKLTTGLPTPDQLSAEKAGYNKALEAQLKKQSDAVMAEAEIKKKMLKQQAETSLAEFQLQIEEQVKMANLQIDQEAQQQSIGLQEAAVTQRTARDEQTAIQAGDYIKKRAMEDMQQKSWELQKQWFDQEQKMTAQYNKVKSAGANAYATPQSMVI
jgi:hypothetical protein